NIEVTRREKVLGDSANYVAHAVMPADANHVLCDGGAGPETGALDQLSDFHIFDHIHTQGAVPAAGFLRRATHQLKRSDSDVSSGPGIRRQPRLVAKYKSKAKIRDGCNFPESAHIDGGEQRQVVPVSLCSERQGATQNVRSKMDVRIGEDQPFAARLFVTGDQC